VLEVVGGCCHGRAAGGAQGAGLLVKRGWGCMVETSQETLLKEAGAAPGSNGSRMGLPW
jgi:hypothetical protein